jgi:hypothetical protein
MRLNHSPIRFQHQNDRLQGTLDLLILTLLARSGRQHGYAIAQRIRQATADSLRIGEGSLYPAPPAHDRRQMAHGPVGDHGNGTESPLLYHHGSRAATARTRRAVSGTSHKRGQ